VKSLLDFVEDSLKFVPNSRRQQITLGEYLNRHSYIHSGEVSSGDTGHILRRKIEETIGSTVGFDNIDWEFAGHQTSPMI